jgi:hypothetical protein
MDSVVGVTTPTMFVAHDGGKRTAGLYPWMFAVWRAQGIEAQLRLYDEDRHTLSGPEDQRDILEASIDWIDRHLKTVPR